MKKLLYSVYAMAFMALAASCGNGRGFAIEGTLPEGDWDGAMAYLVDAHSPVTPLDSAVVKGGTYRFAGEVDEPWMAAVMCEGMVMQCVVEQGKISIEGDRVSGTALNDAMQALADQIDMSDLEGEMQEWMSRYYNAPNATERAAAEYVLDSFEAVGNKRVLDACWQTYNGNGDNLVGEMAMEMIAKVGDFSYAQFDSIISQASERVAANETVKRKLVQLRALDQTAAGKHYTDLQGRIATADGRDGHLGELIDGHVALVDFYASWCGPCRNEIKDNIVPIWKKYRSQGLVVVGLNVWERGDLASRKAAHAKVMADLGIDYPQLVDSTRTATDTYGVNGIPQIMLIGRDGTILARDLRGAAIEEAVRRAL